MQFIERLVDRLGKEASIAPPFMREPTILFAVFRDSQRAVLDLYEFEKELTLLVDRLSKVWAKVAKMGLKSIPTLHGDCCNGNSQIWAPGICMETQENATGQTGYLA